MGRTMTKKTIPIAARWRDRSQLFTSCYLRKQQNFIKFGSKCETPTQGNIQLKHILFKIDNHDSYKIMNWLKKCVDKGGEISLNVRIGALKTKVQGGAKNWQKYNLITRITDNTRSASIYLCVTGLNFEVISVYFSLLFLKLATNTGSCDQLLSIPTLNYMSYCKLSCRNSSHYTCPSYCKNESLFTKSEGNRSLIPTLRTQIQIQ